MECSQPMEEVAAYSGLITCPPETVIHSIKHPIVLGSKPLQLKVESGLLIHGSPLARFLDFKKSGYWKMITKGRGSVSSNPSSKGWETSSKISKVALLPTYTDVILRPRVLQPASTAISRDLGLSSPKLVLPPRCTTVSLRSKSLFSVPQSSVLDLGLASVVTSYKLSKIILTRTEMIFWSKFTFGALSAIGVELNSIPHPQIALRPTCVDLVLRSKNISPTSSIVVPGLGSICFMTHPKFTVLLTWISYLLRPKYFSSLRLELGSFSSMTQSKLAKDILATTCFGCVIPVTAVPLPSPPIDLKISDSESITKNDPRFQALQAKVAAQANIHKECRVRANKAAKALRNVWKRDSKYRRWVKVRKQAEKALQNAGDKLAAIRNEEEKKCSEIKNTEKRL